MTTVDEARAAKRNLAETIAKEVEDFTERTGIGVSSLDLRRIDRTTLADGNRRYRYTVEVEIEL